MASRAEPSFLEGMASRAEPSFFSQKLEPKPSRAEPSFGSDPTLVFTYLQHLYKWGGIDPPLEFPGLSNITNFCLFEHWNLGIFMIFWYFVPLSLTPCAGADLHVTGASEASSKWVGKTKNYYNGSKNWVGKHPYSIVIRQKSRWASAHPAPTPLC